MPVAGLPGERPLIVYIICRYSAELCGRCSSGTISMQYLVDHSTDKTSVISVEDLLHAEHICWRYCMNTRITHTHHSEGVDKMTSCVCEFVCLFVRLFAL